jgi:hypothetical protein
MSSRPYPLRFVGGFDLARSRLTVLFRIILVIPHAVVLTLYGIAALACAIIAWFVAIVIGRVPEGLHGVIAGYLRYYVRVASYAFILADPFPPFGAGGTYPVDLEVDPPTAQNRLTVLFRYILGYPCLLVLYVLEPVLALVAVGAWFVALFAGRVPEGLQTVGIFCVRFIVRTHGYILLVNPRYPAFGDAPGSLPAEHRELAAPQ